MRHDALMIGRYRNIFASRWKAVTWALGVMLTAYCTVPSPEDSAQEKPAKAPPAHVNPWALERPGGG